MSRFLAVTLGLLACGLPAWCDCPKAVVPPGVVQLEHELGARPVDVTVREIRLADVRRATTDEQRQIRASLIGRKLCFHAGMTAEEKAGEIDPLIRDAFQRYGFFRARVAGLDWQEDRSGSPPTVSVTAHMDEGERYRLEKITFAGNKAIANADVLRRAIPTKDGDIFNIDLIREGIKTMRDLYGSQGYINFTPVPNTEVNDSNKTISLAMSLDEGKQFFVGSFTITGADPGREAALRAAWPEYLEPGRIYNANLVKYFFEKTKDLLPPGASLDRNLILKQNPHSFTLDIVLRLQPD